MNSQTSQGSGLDYLLDLDGNIEIQNEEGYWGEDGGEQGRCND